MRPRERCSSCEQMVYTDDVHSCWNERGRIAVRDAEQLVLTIAVDFVDALDLYDRIMSGDHDGPYLSRLGDTQDALRAAVAQLRAAEAGA